MDDIAIRVENLSKQYRIGARQAAYRTLREALTDAVVAPFRRLWRNPQLVLSPVEASAIHNPNSEYIWALKDVSFEACPEPVEGSSAAKWWASLRPCSGQALAATERGRPRLLRQASFGYAQDRQYKAQDPLPHHRADGGAGAYQWPGGLPAGGGALRLALSPVEGLPKGEHLSFIASQRRSNPLCTGVMLDETLFLYAEAGVEADP